MTAKTFIHAKRRGLGNAKIELQENSDHLWNKAIIITSKIRGDIICQG